MINNHDFRKMDQAQDNMLWLLSNGRRYTRKRWRRRRYWARQFTKWSDRMLTRS